MSHFNCQPALDYMAIDADHDALGKECLRAACEAHTGIAVMMWLQAASDYFRFRQPTIWDRIRERLKALPPMPPPKWMEK